ncbi:MAG: glutamyl-tRNA reductase [Candidatus Kapabacteria bacterium]|nr:glutamyl-tRNA reductase [Candidatus Kapabacteria bacterium]
MLNIYAIGTSHKHSPVELRERLAFGEEELPEALRDLQQTIPGESAIISTCNRTELYVRPSAAEFSIEQLKDWLRKWKGAELPDSYFFQLRAANAARHLLEVASGVDSQVIGDIQIIGQVKQSYLIARQQKAVGKVLIRLFETALRTGKRVKAETDLFAGAVSISYVAVELARKIFYPLTNKRTLVIGAGETGELTARNLHAQGVRNVTISNRTESRGLEVIERLGFGQWMPLPALAQRLHEFDIVIVAAGAPTWLVGYEAARAASQQRGGETQLYVDISVPRNVDPKIGTIPNVFCKDLNDLNSVIETNVERRRAELPRADAIIAEELAEFNAWCNLLPVTPVIAQLQQQARTIMDAELAKQRGKFSETEFGQVERLVETVVKRIIGIPMSHLLDAEADQESMLETAAHLRKLFKLDHGE